MKPSLLIISLAVYLSLNFVVVSFHKSDDVLSRAASIQTVNLQMGDFKQGNIILIIFGALSGSILICYISAKLKIIKILFHF